MSTPNEDRDLLLSALNLLTEDVKKGRVNLSYEVELAFEPSTPAAKVRVTYRPQSPVGGVEVEYKK